MRARELMTENPVTADVDTPIGVTAALLYDHDIRHLPIVEGDALVGILSERDLQGYLVAALNQMTEMGESARASTTTAGQIMSGSPITVGPESDHGEIIDLLIEHKIGAVPVVDDHDGSLIGIVSYLDVLNALRDM